jgi:acetyltransferase
VAALRQSGVVVVDTTDEAADAVVALARQRIAPKPDPGIGVLTGQAGPGLLIVDRLKAAGVSVPELASENVQRIESLLPPLTFVRNPVDTGRPSPAFPAVLRAIADDPGIDAVAVFALHEPAALDPVAVLGPGAGKPLLFATTGLPESIAPTLAALTQAGIPAFGSPERLATAARALAEDARLAWRVRRGAVATPIATPQGVPEAPFDEAKAKALVTAYGIPVPDGVACSTRAEAPAAFAALRKPVVAKILAAEVAHKTEAGGVKVGIDSPTALERALAALDAIPLSGPRRYLIEEMAPVGTELIAGAVRDPSFGPVVLVGLGGTAAEALQDTAVRLAPLSEEDALGMLDELRGRRLLDGWRGAPPVDRGAIARAIVALGRILIEHPTLAEIEINPLRATAGGVLALDALVIVEG